MKSAPFEYIRPRTVAEASVALLRKGVSTAAIAGGQSLLPMLNLRVAQVDMLVDISRLDDLKVVAKTPDSVWIGALATHAAIEDGKVPDTFGGLMRRIASQISYRAVRNHGTIGGSVALADPASDWPCVLIALDASVRVAGRNGIRMETVSDLVRGSYETTLATGDIVVGFDVPSPPPSFRWGFAKVTRKSGAFAHSIAIATSHGRDGPMTVTLGATKTRPYKLISVAEAVRADRPHDVVRQAIALELVKHCPDADEYEKRMHTANILRAIRDMKAQ
jgi:carbon-monoxide dehydrogenase medium subunit